MNYIHTTKQDRTTAHWAGGTTTQLCVFPETAEFMKFNFQFRISTATVEIEESTFTFFPGITRNLMILDGILEIDHTDRYKKTLQKFDQDTFSGEWPTTAKGKVTDFNLMTTGTAQGKISSFVFSKNENKDFAFGKTTDYLGMYLLKGTAEISGKYFSIQMNEGDFVLLKHENKQDEIISVCAKNPADLILSEVIL